MSTQFDSYSYHHRPSISPPVSPKTLPHGFKRKASSQDDEVENHAQISNSFKRLRLKDGKRTHSTNANPTGYVYREIEPFAQPMIEPSSSFERAVTADVQDDDDYMGVDDTHDRVWIHDLDAEIKQIEAEEALHSNGVHIVDGGSDYSRVPDHILKHNPKTEDPASNLQMVLYRDPISISVPQEEDAVRKAIIEARRRMREKQQEQLAGASHITSNAEPVFQTPYYAHASVDYAGDDGMDID